MTSGHARTHTHTYTRQVHARFIRDLEKFNEWMNEEDYLDMGDAENQAEEGNTMAEAQSAEVGDEGDGDESGKRKRDDEDTGKT
jgi:hypothetical protein